jgi:hypothetical protein
MMTTGSPAVGDTHYSLAGAVLGVGPVFGARPSLGLSTGLESMVGTSRVG